MESNYEEYAENVDTINQNDAKPPMQIQLGEKRIFQYAGFWMRFWAYLLDLIVIGSVNRLIIYPVFRALDISINDGSMFAPITILTAITFYLYFTIMTKVYSQTLGKMVFGIKVVPLEHKNLNWSTVLFREIIGRFISVTIIIGYLIVAFVPKKQGLHDIFADTTVVHER